jgi:hypothetical protein
MTQNDLWAALAQTPTGDPALAAFIQYCAQDAANTVADAPSWAAPDGWLNQAAMVVLDAATAPLTGRAAIDISIGAANVDCEARYAAYQRQIDFWCSYHRSKGAY